MLRIALTVLALLALPAPALAAEGFVGVTETGGLVRFTSQQPLDMMPPIRIRGLLPGERIVALDTGRPGLVGVGTSARLYAINPRTGRAAPIGLPFSEGLRGSRFSLAAAPGATSARLLSDVGQDLVIDLTTGVAQPGPGVRRADNGEPIRPAVDAAADGQLVGVQLGPRLKDVSQFTLFRQTALGAPTVSATPVEQGRNPEPKLGEPLGFQIGSDGRGYALAVLTDGRRVRQSALQVIDLGTSKKAGSAYPQSLPVRVNTFASLGPVRDDRTPPAVKVSLAPRVSVRGLFDKRIPLRVGCSEGCSVSGTAEIAGQRVGGVYGSRFFAGFVSPIDFYILSGRGQTNRIRNLVRHSAGRRIRLVLRISDWNWNRRRVVQTARLVR